MVSNSWAFCGYLHLYIYHLVLLISLYWLCWYMYLSVLIDIDTFWYSFFRKNIFTLYWRQVCLTRHYEQKGPRDVIIGHIPVTEQDVPCDLVPYKSAHAVFESYPDTKLQIVLRACLFKMFVSCYTRETYVLASLTHLLQSTLGLTMRLVQHCRNHAMR